MAKRRGGEDEAIPDDPDGFLCQFQWLQRYQPARVIWVPGDGIIENLAELDLTQKQAADLIKNDLRPEHHHRGPEPDDHAAGTGKICIFRCPVPGTPDAYVKIGLELIRKPGDNLVAKIWSFKKWGRNPSGGQP